MNMLRHLYAAVLRWQLACLREERERYAALGWVGPIYLRNVRQQELGLMGRIRELTMETSHV